jgi:hypothetical protein
MLFLDLVEHHAACILKWRMLGRVCDHHQVMFDSSPDSTGKNSRCSIPGKNKRAYSGSVCDKLKDRLLSKGCGTKAQNPSICGLQVAPLPCTRSLSE